MPPTFAPDYQHKRGFTLPLRNTPLIRRQLRTLCLYNTVLIAGLSPEKSSTQGKALYELNPRWPSFFMQTRRMESCPPVERGDLCDFEAIDSG